MDPQNKDEYNLYLSLEDPGINQNQNLYKDKIYQEHAVNKSDKAHRIDPE
jgi:hypothetical protein